MRVARQGTAKRISPVSVTRRAPRNQPVDFYRSIHRHDIHGKADRDKEVEVDRLGIVRRALDDHALLGARDLDVVACDFARRPRHSDPEARIRPYSDTNAAKWIIDINRNGRQQSCRRGQQRNPQHASRPWTMRRAHQKPPGSSKSLSTPGSHHSLHFSPPDGRSTRYDRQDFVALACRAQRTVQVRLRAPSGARLVLTALSPTSPRHVVRKGRLAVCCRRTGRTSTSRL